MTKLVYFRNFADAPKDDLVFSPRLLVIIVFLHFPSSRMWAKLLFIPQFLQMLVCQHFGCGNMWYLGYNRHQEAWDDFISKKKAKRTPAHFPRCPC